MQHMYRGGDRMDFTPMRILLIEDSPEDRELFTEHINGRQDVMLVGITNSSEKGIEIIKHCQPEAIILDLELIFGEGSGIELLNQLEHLGLKPKPIIVVTTHIPSKIVHTLIHGKGVDFIFYKLQTGYSPERVISFLLLMRNPAGGNATSQRSPSQSHKDGELARAIERELDAVGISMKYTGRKYITDALKLISSENSKTTNSAIRQVSESVKKEYSSVIRAMETAIKNAWYDSKTDAEKHYTGRIDKRKGYPTPSDFIHFFKEKLRKQMI